MAKPIGTHALNLVRGALIGTAEVVPGISGGTVALITGIYETIITSAGHVVSGIRLTVSDLPRGRGMARAGAEFRQADWAAVIAVLIGMATAALTAAKLLAPLVESERQFAYAVFFGLVLASVYVPYSSTTKRWRVGDYLLALGVAAVAFVLIGLPPSEIDPNPLIITAAAAVAVSALVLPGMSGSLILLTLGLYTSTMNAVNDRDMGYLGFFFLGALLGGALFVKLLQWVLEHHHHLAMVVMTGLLAGSLRALWPWQEEDRTFTAPTEVPFTVLLMAVGFVLVVAILLLERATRSRRGGAEEGHGGRHGGHGGHGGGHGGGAPQGGRHARPASGSAPRM
ncbi:DUF368 domain-containing protein [Nocardiopsis sp. RSe5-2]|uniref:DUF368 domain-containing protein n=1 Tax=Nocardiopsis endophytica TaxID=3018445 RepID=A0ABT4U976_9ACTN|nr:DUF368 domain-containing protein [Nocardiopsis endophytica]MDA2813505.1 DUF368 domain-containing protein [Nocardiopsis endophytica]